MGSGCLRQGWLHDDLWLATFHPVQVELDTILEGSICADAIMGRIFHSATMIHIGDANTGEEARVSFRQLAVSKWVPEAQPRMLHVLVRTIGWLSDIQILTLQHKNAVRLRSSRTYVCRGEYGEQPGFRILLKGH